MTKGRLVNLLMKPDRIARLGHSAPPNVAAGMRNGSAPDEMMWGFGRLYACGWRTDVGLSL